MALLELSPEIGWLNVEDIFDTTKNPLAYSKDSTLLDAFGGTINEKHRTPDTLSFTISGSDFIVPAADRSHFRRLSNRTFLVRIGGVVSRFKLVTSL